MSATRILLVEDSRTWRTILETHIRTALPDSELQLHVAATYPQAENELRGREWDLLVTDIGLPPGRDHVLGMHLVGIARKKNVPCIVVSGSEAVTKEHVRDMLSERYQARDFFSKEELRSSPVKQEEFQDLIRRSTVEREAGDRDVPASATIDPGATAPSKSGSRAVEIFFSYSHKDRKLRDQLETHLTMLKRQGIIAGWHDRQIPAGTEWKGAIDEHLESARIILLLVSPDFLSSDYCYEKEMTRAMERHESVKARVIPVILRHCDWHSARFGKLQALPEGGKPVTDWNTNKRDKVFQAIADRIREFVTELA